MASSHLAGDVRDAAAKQTRRSIWSGTLARVGLVAFTDETVFHQLLHWHHFYDKSTLAAGLAPDGLVSSERTHRDGRRAFPAGRCAPQGRLRPETMVGGLLLGAGPFQLLGLHQIRYHVSIWPYDLTWNLIAFIMILAGVLLMKGDAGIARSSLLRPDARPAA